VNKPTSEDNTRNLSTDNQTVNYITKNAFFRNHFYFLKTIYSQYVVFF